MRTITKTVYTFEELSEDAKLYAINKEIEDSIEIKCHLFHENCLYLLNEKFPNSTLNVQYSLNYCQCDGVNIYGDLNYKDILDNLPNMQSLSLTSFEKKIYKLIKSQIYQWGISVQLNENRRYTYNVNNVTDLIEQVTQEFDGDKLNNYLCKLDDIDDFYNKIFGELFNKVLELNEIFEKDGYEYFYTPLTEEEMQEICDDNGWEFDEFGEII